MTRERPPAGFISGPHMHDPRDPSVYYPTATVKKAMRKRAKPNPSKIRVYLRYGGSWLPRMPGETIPPGAKSKLVSRSSILHQHRAHPRKTPVPHLRRRRLKSRKGRGRIRNPGWYIHIQRAPRGPVMIFNGRSFTNQPDDKPMPYVSANAAMYKARHLLGKYNDKLRVYKIWVSDMIYGASHEKRRVNPDTREKLDQAAQKLEDFTGHGATHVERARTRSDEKTGLVIGEMDLVGYRAARKGVEGGRMTRYAHKFRKGSRPLLAVSTDGKQLHVVGGQYEFTDAGIEDR